MKKVLPLFVAFAALAACQQASPNLNRANVGAQSVQTAGSQSHHPDFLRKLSNIATFKVQREVGISSICGKNDLQQVNDYDGTLGQPIEFVNAHKNPVAAMAEGSPAKSDKFCTGTMISPDLFITASHCVDSSTPGKWVVFNYETKPKSKELLPQEHFKIAAVVEEGAAQPTRLDYAILRIEGNPGAKFGFTPVRAVTPPKGHLLTIIQHPSGNPKQIESGPVAGEEGNYVLYSDLDTEPGSSGSGVLDKDGAIVAIHTNGGCTASGGANRGVKMADIAKASPTIQKLLAGRR